MQSLIVLALIGVGAQLVDGSLGMAFGVTSTTMLLAAGVSPAVASAGVHLAEVGTSLVSGISHWRFRNVDWGKIAWLALPGGLGGFLGASVLTSVPAEVAKPVVAVILCALGAYVFLRFALDTSRRPAPDRPVPSPLLSPLGLAAGFLDAMGGGGWGPVGSSTLLASGRMEPRKVIGTVSASEFIVTVCASIGFLLALTAAQLPFRIVGALLAGGVVAAPFAAWAVRHLDARVLGVLVGGLIVLTNVRIFLDVAAPGILVTVAVYALLVAGWITGLSSAIRRSRRDRDARRREAVPSAPRA